MDFNYPAKFEPLIKLLKSNQGSTGVPFWPTHPSRICVDAPVRTSTNEFFFFGRDPIWSEIGPNMGSIWSEMV